MFVFHGADSKVGTTMISQSVAEIIAENLKDKRILFTSLNGRSNNQYVDRIGESIEGIKLYLDNKVLSKKELTDCRQSPLFQADFCYVEACKPDKKLVQ